LRTLEPVGPGSRIGGNAMRVCDHVQCDGFPCRDVHHEP
jgi:hypothetical protein